MPDSLVLPDAILGAEGRLRQNGEVLFSLPSKHQLIPGQRNPRLILRQRQRAQAVKYEPTCVISYIVRALLAHDDHSLDNETPT